MDTRDRLEALLDLLYAAPGTVAGWSALLDAVCSSLEGCGASFISMSSARRATVSVNSRTDPATLAAYLQHWCASDPWGTSPGIARVQPSEVVSGLQLIPEPELLRTEFYNDFGRSHGIVRALIGMIEKTSAATSVISINRSEDCGEFSSEDTVLLTALMPHLHRGLQIHRRLSASEAMLTDLSVAVDTSPHAFICVTAGGTVTFMNRKAEELTRQRDGIAFDAGELRATDHAGTITLRAMIARAASTTSGDGVEPGGACQLSRPSGRRPLIAVVAPLRRHRPELPGVAKAAAMVIITDPESSVLNAAVARALWKLTPSELRLLALLTAGASPAVAAIQLGVASETVRKRLKSIFEKTDTHRQAELVALVLRNASVPSATELHQMQRF